jgi:predicted nucleic-acid-binding protein
MIAVDTNILARLLVGDDLKQMVAAEALFASGQIWIGKTVLLETEWVLRNSYGFDAEAVRKSILSVVGLSHVHLEDEPAVQAALELNEQGLDFADALHLCSRPAGAEFVSFDRALVRRATRAGIADVSMVPPV